MTMSHTTVFVVDTNVWIRLYEECYPPDVFPGLYHKLVQCAHEGKIRSPRQVLTELGDQRHGVSGWIRTLNPSIVMKETQAVAKKVGDVCTKFPDLIKGKTLMEADPFVVAHACIHGYVVVTEEMRPIHPNAKPKIPVVCDFYRVRCISTLAMLRELQVKL